MKRIKQIIIVLTIAILSSVQTGCIGSFGLTNKIYDFNNDLGDKFVNEVVFFGLCVVQVYTVSIIIDGLILNSIEFWTGESVISENCNGEEIKLTKIKNGIKVENLSTGEEVSILNDKETQSVYAVQKNSKTKLLEYDQTNNTATLFFPNQTEKKVLINDKNLAAIQSEMANYMDVAMK